MRFLALPEGNSTERKRKIASIRTCLSGHSSLLGQKTIRTHRTTGHSLS
jgi:hypothetical protein